MFYSFLYWDKNDSSTFTKGIQWTYLTIGFAKSTNNQKLQLSEFATAFAEIDFYLSDNKEDIFPRWRAIYLHIIVWWIKWQISFNFGDLTDMEKS